MLRYETKTWRDLRRRLLVVGCALVASSLLLAAFGQHLLAATLVGSAVLTSLLVPLATMTASRAGAVCEPGGRSHHQVATPLFGGVALFLPILVLLGIRAALDDPYLWGVLLGATVMLTLGVVDDVRGVRARTKLLVQIVSGLILVWFGARIPELGLKGVGVISTGWMAKPLVVLLVVAISNAMNVIDGLDGLATTISLVAAGALAILGVHPVMTVALVGACLGFLVFNLPRARVFLGDAGSLTLGFVLTSFALHLPTSNNIPLAVALFAYPAGDMTLAVVRRIVRGKPIMSPDGSHTHHKLRDHLGGTTAALMFVSAFAIVVTGVGILRPSVLFLGMAALAWIALAAGIIVAGRYQVGAVLASRRPFRRTHAAYRYAVESIRLAREPEHVFMTVRHAADAFELSVRDIHQLAGGRIDERLLATTTANAVTTASSATSHDSSDTSRAVMLERQNLLLDICRRATARLGHLDRQSDTRPPVRTQRRQTAAR